MRLDIMADELRESINMLNKTQQSFREIKPVDKIESAIKKQINYYLDQSLSNLLALNDLLLTVQDNVDDEGAIELYLDLIGKDIGR